MTYLLSCVWHKYYEFRNFKDRFEISIDLISIPCYWIVPVLSKDPKSCRVDKCTWQIESVSCNIKLAQSCMKDRNHLFQRKVSDLVDLSCSQFYISVGALPAIWYLCATSVCLCFGLIYFIYFTIVIFFIMHPLMLVCILISPFYYLPKKVNSVVFSTSSS